MAREIAVALVALLISSSLPVACRATLETTETSTSTTESSTTTSTDSTGTFTSTTVPGPFTVTQSVLVFGNGTQEEVESLVSGAFDFVLAEIARAALQDIVDLSPQENCTQDAQCPMGDMCSTEFGVCFPPYLLRTSGRCTEHVRTIQECAAAAHVVGVSGVGPRDDGQESVDWDPPFCYFETGIIYFNQVGNTGECSSRDQCLCATSDRSLRYGNLSVAAATEVPMRSGGGTTLGYFLDDARGWLPDSVNAVDFVGDLAEGAAPFISCLFGGCGGRRATASSGALWRVDARVTAYDKFTSEYLYDALYQDQSFDTDFEDALQAQTIGSGLMIHFAGHSAPLVLRPTETTTETQTATTISPTTTSETTVTATATTTTTTPAAAGQPAPSVESSTALIVAVAGGSAVFLSGVVAAFRMHKRRKVGNAVQCDIEMDVDRATATSNSGYSGNIIEI